MKSYILKTGPGVPLVFLHGLFGRASDWEALVSFLPHCTCIAYDLPGHGESPFTSDIHIPLETFHLIGYSMGARIAKRIPALSHTFISAHPGLKTREEKESRLNSDREWIRLFQRESLDSFFQKWYSQSIFYRFHRVLPQRADVILAMEKLSLAHDEYTPMKDVLVGEHDDKFRMLHENPLLIPDAGHAAHLQNPRKCAEILRHKIFQS